MLGYGLEFFAVSAFAMATFGLSPNAKIAVIIYYLRKMILFVVKNKLV